ncbi:MAG: dienelactone hydrolase family protein [Pseudomonadota bacterium]
MLGSSITPLVLVITALALALTPARAETVGFAAEDGLEITAEIGGPSSGPVLVLFHMARASRGEYRDIAPRLHEMGYRTLSVDQRSGGSFNGVRNETAARVGGDPGFLAAIPDLEAAVTYARGKMGAATLGVVGSSYSASLVLALAGRDPDFADAVISFSPGEYFPDRSFVRDATSGISTPVFLTAARSEINQLESIANVIKSEIEVFRPEGAGRHGATALLTADGPEYWTALSAFLVTHLPPG